MRHGNSRVRRSCDPCGHARHHFERNRRIVQRLRFLAAASKHERIAAFEPHNPLSIASKPNEKLVDIALRNRLVVATALPYIEQLGVACLDSVSRKQILVGERIVDDRIRRLDQLLSANGDQSRITRASANEKDDAATHAALRSSFPLIDSGSTPIDSHHVAYSDGEISDGLISLRPPQK